MNAMIRGLKALIALSALAGAGFALRWVTAGAMEEASTRDLISMAFVAVAAVAWTAYAWRSPSRSRPPCTGSRGSA